MKPAFLNRIFFFLILILIIPLAVSCASKGALKAEEYFSIGMAYYELGQSNQANRERYFQEAERWLNRARAADKTMTASDYNLGRLAFENARYEEASRSFERILAKDPANIMALKAAAYSRIMNGNLDLAEAHYGKVLELVPESADDGYNYALVLFGMKKYKKSEEVLNRYPHALEENAASILLLARVQKAQDKVEAVDSYAKWIVIANSPPAQGIYEYAQVLENAGLFAKAIEYYGEAAKAMRTDTDDLKKSAIIFDEARLLLSADPLNDAGIEKLSSAVTEGFSDQEAIRELLLDERISAENKAEIKTILESFAENI